MNTESNKLTVYHASIEIIKEPRWDYVLKNNKKYKTSDFGPGFYTSKDTEQPIKLLCQG